MGRACPVVLLEGGISPVAYKAALRMSSDELPKALLCHLYRISMKADQAIMDTREQSHALDSGTDSGSAGFPTPRPQPIPLPASLWSLCPPSSPPSIVGGGVAPSLPSCPPPSHSSILLVPCSPPLWLPPILPPFIPVAGHGDGHLARLVPCLYLVLVSQRCPVRKFVGLHRHSVVINPPPFPPLISW